MNLFIYLFTHITGEITSLLFSNLASIHDSMKSKLFLIMLKIEANVYFHKLCK